MSVSKTDNQPKLFISETNKYGSDKSQQSEFVSSVNENGRQYTYPQREGSSMARTGIKICNNVAMSFMVLSALLPSAAAGSVFDDDDDLHNNNNVFDDDDDLHNNNVFDDDDDLHNQGTDSDFWSGGAKVSPGVGILTVAAVATVATLYQLFNNPNPDRNQSSTEA
ncbi:MAG: hypothetical protein AAGG81_05525 [Chlamydiota bacterium]